MPIESTRSCQCWIKNIWQVCCSHQYYALDWNVNRAKIWDEKCIRNIYHNGTICISTSFCSKPSISTSSWFNVFLVWPSHCFLVDPTASISSMNMMQGAYEWQRGIKYAVKEKNGRHNQSTQCQHKLNKRDALE